MQKDLEKGLRLALMTLEAFRDGKDLSQVMDLTGLDRDSLLQIEKQVSKQASKDKE